MATYVDQYDENGVMVAQKVRLLPTTPSLPPGHTWVPHEVPVDTIRQQMLQDVIALRDLKLSKGGFKVGDKWFHSDTFSRSQQLGLTMLGTNLPPNIDWKTMDKSFVRLTPTLVQQIFVAAVQQDNAIFSHAELLKVALNNASDPETVDINVGWPETFGNI